MAVLKIKKADGSWDVVNPITTEVKYIAQTLTDAQQAQARANIGIEAATTDEIDAAIAAAE